MKTCTLKSLSISIFALAMIPFAAADSFKLSDGSVSEGSLYKVHDGVATIEDAAGEKHDYSIKAFDGATRKAIKEWSKANPDRVDVYTKWDSMPVIKSSAMPQLPEQFHNPAFKGMVSVDLVLDSEGRVIQAKIKKSTHTELEGPSLEAAKTWLFEPAKVGGKSVKSKLRVPFKFTFTEKPKEAPAA